MADSRVEEHWPHLVALQQLLDDLDGREVKLKPVAHPDDEARKVRSRMFLHTGSAR